MPLFPNHRNFGWGKRVAWAGQNALKQYYGHGHFASSATNASRWRQFCNWLAEVRYINDATQIDQTVLSAYAAEVARSVLDEEMSITTAQNRLSAVSTTLCAMRGDRLLRIESPADWVGRRHGPRTDAPTGLDLDHFAHQSAEIRARGYPRAAIVMQLARHCGVRLREAVLADVGEWVGQATRLGKIDVRRGTKGGRGNHVARWVPATESTISLLREARQKMDQLGCAKNLLRLSESYEGLVENGEINRARSHLHQLGLKGYHDLRTAWACDRYALLTGVLAPVLQTQVVADRQIDHEARKIISGELGHGRPEIVAEYIGRRPR